MFILFILSFDLSTYNILTKTTTPKIKKITSFSCKIYIEFSAQNHGVSVFHALKYFKK